MKLKDVCKPEVEYTIIFAKSEIEAILSNMKENIKRKEENICRGISSTEVTVVRELERILTAKA